MSHIRVVAGAIEDLIPHREKTNNLKLCKCGCRSTDPFSHSFDCPYPKWWETRNDEIRKEKSRKE